MATPPEFCKSSESELSPEVRTRFYQWLAQELNVPVHDPRTCLGTSIHDPDRIAEFARFYLEHNDLHPSFRGELAEVVWDSLDPRLYDDSADAESLALAREVFVDAQNNDYFCGFLMRCVLYCVDPDRRSVFPYPHYKWLFTLEGFDVEAVAARAVRNLGRSMAKQQPSQPPFDIPPITTHRPPTP